MSSSTPEAPAGAAPLTRLRRLRDRWRDPSLTMLLAVQCLTIFGLSPAAAAGLVLSPDLVVAVLLAFTSLTILATRSRWTLSAGLATLVLSIAAVAMECWRGSVATTVAADLIAAATFVLLTVVVFGAVFGPGRFTAHRVRGAVVLYLNVGLLFAFLHRALAELVPGAFSNLPGPEHRAAFRAALDYFSFATLTSVGYGDMTPVHPLARGLAMLEAAIGQLFPTALLARVVTLAMREEDD